MLRIIRTTLLSALITPLTAPACSTCFGAADDMQTRGMNAAILVLLTVLGGVLITLALAGMMCVMRVRRTPLSSGAGDPV